MFHVSVWELVFLCFILFCWGGVVSCFFLRIAVSILFRETEKIFSVHT